MVYDSRSGSTFLSKRLTEEAGGIIVTPEIGFDRLFSSSVGEVPDWKSLIQKMYKGHEFINLGIPQQELLMEFSSHAPVSIPQGIDIILRKWLEADQGLKDYAGWIVVKNGSHLKYIDKIAKIFNYKIPFLFLLRDPRAVINSKYNAKRPYYPHENMVWSGLLLTALRWKIYYRKIKKAKKKGVPVLEIKYEDLVRRTDEVIDSAKSFLGIRCGEEEIKYHRTKKEYAIPEKEMGIHKLTSKSYGVEERINSWRKELSSFRARVVEAICFRELKAEGYDLLYNDNFVVRLMLMMLALPDTFFSLTRHSFVLLNKKRPF